MMTDLALRIMIMVLCSHALRLPLNTKSMPKSMPKEDSTTFYMEDSAKCPPWSQCPEMYVDHNDLSLSLQKRVLPSHRTLTLMAVFNGANLVDRRQAVRGLWNSSRNAIQSDDDLLRKFVICSDGHVLEQLRHEAENYKDILFLECTEGYSNGLLTMKTASLMKHFVDNFPKGSLLFKTDDDTYVDTYKLMSAMAHHSQEEYVYAGLKYPKGGIPITDQKNPFYEPWNVWDQKYPPSMAGGPGYLLSYRLVQDIVEQELPKRYPLYNEDKAVGVWVQEIEKNTKVNWVQLSATDGYNLNLCKFMKRRAADSWTSYPFMMQHHLSPDHLKCFSYDDLKPSCFC